MTLAIVFTLIDFLLNHATFSYQRATLLIARKEYGTTNVRDAAEIQMLYTPTWLGAIGWLSWITFIVAIYFLWQVWWMCAIIYALIRLIFSAFLPTFESQLAHKIFKKYGHFHR